MHYSVPPIPFISAQSPRASPKKPRGLPLNITTRTRVSVSAVALLAFTACQPTPPTTEDAQNAPADTPSLVHDRVLVLDAHADIEIPTNLSIYVGADGRSRIEPGKLQAGGTNAVVMNAAVGPQPRTPEGYAVAEERALEEIEAVTAMAKVPENHLVIAKSAQDVLDAKRNDQTAAILGLQNALIFGTDVDAIDRFHDYGVRVFALTHMGHNDFADSSRPLFNATTGVHEPDAEHGGLSKLGLAAVERINALGGLLDVSQLSKQATLQVIESSTTPVIASHSNVRSLCNVSRNLSDEEIDLIGQTGGVIHVTPFRGYLYDSSDTELDANIRAARRDADLPEDFLYPFELYWELEPEAGRAFAGKISDLLGPGSIDSMLDHLDYIVDRIGIDHVGIGTDFNHGGGVEGYQDASEAPNVTAKMIERGYSEEDIAKIWGGNFLRVFEGSQSIDP